MSTANDGQQHKDNDNIITQYFEFNKDRILYLTEKNYENLVEALTNNAINTAASSSNATLLSPSIGSDTYIKEESESFHHSRGDIAD